MKEPRAQTDSQPGAVQVTSDTDPASSARFTDAFRIGRDPDCAVRVEHGKVSRAHAEVFPEGGRWWIKDLGSTNGTLLNGARIDRALLEGESEVRLGTGGPLLRLIVYPALEPTDLRGAGAAPMGRGADRTEPFREPAAEAGRTTEPVPAAPHSPEARPAKPVNASLDAYVERYFQDGGEAGEHTRMVREAYRHVQRKQTRRYTGVIAGLVVLGLCAAAFGGYKAIEYRNQQKEMEILQARIEALENQAREIFYGMKQLELTAGDSPAMMAHKAQYVQFVEELDSLRERSPEDRAIYRMARLFGECDLDMPEAFRDKVREYIGYWQQTARLHTALERAEQNAYVYPIARAFLERDLPPQFFYLALQESNFNREAVGPITRYGYAKGMWQFIPATAMQYGLQTGPLVEIGQTDPLDERHDFAKSTGAAAAYIRYIYDTDAQASGLLVMASYNWGEGNVLRFIRQLPANPRERNFWKLLEAYEDRIPDETYTYVFSIFSAAVIGENPRLFGFDFDNPLAYAIEALQNEPTAPAEAH